LQVEAGGEGVRVVAPMPGSPAARAGLQAGDVIVKLDDQPLLGVPLSDAISRMRGQPGTPVSITVRRPGIEQEFTVALTRDTIRRQVLRSSVEGDVLVLRLAAFTGSAASSVEKAIAEATAAGLPRGIVLDMRGNGGGLLREAVSLADVFLREGDIVSLRGRAPGNQRAWKADAAELLAGVPMVVLVDNRSASATELVAAALQENGRAVVMGQRSFGKGTVQSTFALGEHKGALKLTTSTYHGPSGRSVQKVGVTPDVELTPAVASRCPAILKEPDAALSCALAFARAGTIDAFLAALPAPLPPIRD
jgi:carboxyl-terminal processing protease